MQIHSPNIHLLGELIPPLENRQHLDMVLTARQPSDSLMSQLYFPQPVRKDPSLQPTG